MGEEAEAENEQRARRRQLKTPKKRVRFSPVTEIQMLPLEEEDQNAENEEQTTLLDTTTIQMPRPAPLEDDEDSEDEEATPLNTTEIQMSTLEEDHNSDEEQTLWA